MYTTTVLLVLIAEPIIARSPKPLSYAALGDSYAAGDGAGSSRLLPSLDLLCARFSESYPYQLVNSQNLDVSQLWPGFEYKACGGATTASVSLVQKYTLRHKDLVTVQVGGNEIDFFLLLNECIQQWWPVSSCSYELDRARGLVEDPAFARRYYDMVRGILDWQQGTTLLVLGYARFFNAETTPCNNVSFSVRDPTNTLTHELRRDLNALVEMLNSVIRESAETAGAFYVDIDAVFEDHRFCERGVREPIDWPKTWFFRSTEGRKVEQIVLQSPFDRFNGLTRSFHPTGDGHAAIAKEIARLYLSLNAEK